MKDHFPTELHASIAEIVEGFARALPECDTVLVANSCARAQATPESDLDMAILVDRGSDLDDLESAWIDFASSNHQIQSFVQRNSFSAVHVSFFDGHFVPPQWDDGGGPDDFEIEIGNFIAHSRPVPPLGDYFVELQSQWLPYYDGSLRKHRLEMSRDAYLHDLEFIPFYLERGLYLQGFDRLYKAFREFLQMLFIHHSTYPIAYNKWLAEQLGWVNSSHLLHPLLSILSVTDLTSKEINTKAEMLRDLDPEVGT